MGLQVKVPLRANPPSMWACIYIAPDCTSLGDEVSRLVRVHADILDRLLNGSAPLVLVAPEPS